MCICCKCRSGDAILMRKPGPRLKTAGCGCQMYMCIVKAFDCMCGVGGEADYPWQVSGVH